MKAVGCWGPCLGSECPRLPTRSNGVKIARVWIVVTLGDHSPLHSQMGNPDEYRRAGGTRRLSLAAHTQPGHSPRWRRFFQRIAWFEPFWVFVVGGLLLLPPRFLPEAWQSYTVIYRPLGVALLALGWPVRVIAYRKLTRRTPLDWPLLLLLLWLPVNYWASADKTLSWEAISYLAFGIAGYFALLNWPPAQRQPQIIAWFILLLGIGLTVAAPLLSELDLSKLFRVGTLGNVFQQLSANVPGNVNANRVAGALVVMLPLPVALALLRCWRARRLSAILYAAVAALMSAVLVLTQSRGAYLAAAVAIALILGLRWPKLLYALPLVLLIGGVIVVHIGPRVVLEGVLSGGAINGLDGRLELWSRALYAISDFSFTGIGIGTFQRVIPILYPLFSIGPDVLITHAHNLLLQVGVDLGLPGLIAYLALFINTFALLVAALRRREATLDWVLAAGALGGLTAMLVHGIFDAPVWGSKPAFLPWLLVVLSVQVGLRAATQSASTHEATQPRSTHSRVSH